MADIVNLNTFRKAKARAEKEQKAKDNRFKFGRPKVLKDIEKANKALESKRFEAHHLDPVTLKPIKD
ncbi:MAG: DUF4169 family protein [Alphaproteobacteria bacterium]|nr:DUF4169 family protein [Alphaproteobacteria bacterium]